MGRADRENVYLIDVRTSDEYARGHIPGFQWFPGGQAVQRADDLVAVKNGQVVFACDGRVRATVAASWYARWLPECSRGGRRHESLGCRRAGAGQERGYERAPGYDEGIGGALPAGYEAAKAQVELLDPASLEARRAGSQSPLVIFVDTSREFINGHVAGSRWVPRGWLELSIGDVAPSKDTPLVVTCGNGLNSVLAERRSARSATRASPCSPTGCRRGFGPDYPWSAASAA